MTLPSARCRYASIHEALGALEDYLDPLSFSGDDPRVVRIVVRSGEQYQAKVRKATVDEITLVNLPPHGATKRINAADISYLAVALPAPRRWLTVALTTLGLGDIVVVAARLLRPWLGADSLIILTVVVGTAAFIAFQGYDQPGSNLLPWVVTFSEPNATFSDSVRPPVV
jgi:hypothetical protein